MKRVLVLGEIKDAKIRNVTLECVSAARKIANGGKIIGALLGEIESSLPVVLGHYGVNTVYLIPHQKLNLYTQDTYTQALVQLIDQTKPDVILMGHTSIGKDLAPRLAARLGIGLISDVTGLELEGEEIIFTRPIYSGKAFQKKKVLDSKVFATIRPNNIEIGEIDSNRSAEQVTFEIEIKDLRTVIKDVVRKAVSGVDLSEAKVVVSGGRGVKSAEGFSVLQELADVLGAAVGASRGACDAGYCDYSLQIGQTGKIVTPDLYIACGISGAIQHLSGMSNSKMIVAINKDPEAPIFQVADYGIVGDLFEVVPLLTEELKKELVVS